MKNRETMQRTRSAAARAILQERRTALVPTSSLPPIEPVLNSLELGSGVVHLPPTAKRVEPCIDPATLPDTYAMVLEGTCMLPAIPDLAVVGISKVERPRPGDYVILWRRPELVPPGQHQGILKRLVLNIPPYVKFPWREHPDSDVHAIALVEMLNPHRQFTYKCADLLAVHKAIGLLPESRAGATHAEGDLQPFPTVQP